MRRRAARDSRTGRSFPEFLHPPSIYLDQEQVQKWRDYSQGGNFPACGLESSSCNRVLATRPGAEEESMPKYVIERDIPGIGNVTPQEVVAISQKSCSVLQNLGPQIQWLHSYVTGDKIYCVYIAPNEEIVREHAKQGGFPANRVSEVKLVIDPTSAEA
jgi:hypothetical protein